MALQQLNSHIQSHKYFISGILIAINILLAIDVVQHRAVQPDCNAQSSATGLVSTTDPSSIKVFVAILSRAKNKVVRQAIRDSWGADPRLVSEVAVSCWCPLSAAFAGKVIQHVHVLAATGASFINGHFSTPS